MDGVALFWFGQRHGILCVLEAIGAVGETVRPRDERRPVFAVAHGSRLSGSRTGLVTQEVLPDAAADLDDSRPLVAVAGSRTVHLTVALPWRFRPLSIGRQRGYARNHSFGRPWGGGAD